MIIYMKSDLDSQHENRPYEFQVLPDGTYIKPSNARLGYGTMVWVRTQIVTGCSNAMAMASTIAIRYSAVRRQTEETPGYIILIVIFGLTVGQSLGGGGGQKS